MKSRIVSIAALALAAVLAMPLAACGSGQGSQGDGAQASSDTPSSTQAASMDVSNWKTLGDALAFKGEGNSTAAWDEGYYAAVFEAGDSIVRVVAKMTPEVYAKIGELDGMDSDYEQKFNETLGALELAIAEDVTAEKIAQSELDAYVGKTGQDLMNDGFLFQNYYMYGGDETGATMDKGNLSYIVDFDATVAEDQIGDEGAAIKGASIKSIEYAGGSNAAVDLQSLE